MIIAGFAPFDGRSRNRSWEAVRRMRSRPGMAAVELPVDYGELKKAVPGLADRRPGVILLVGEAPCRHVRVEQVALNVADWDRPDNAGHQPRGEELVAGAPLALRAVWDARAVARRLSQGGIVAAPSFHAGTFACNAALYFALYALPDARVGFLHVPQRRWPFGPRLALLVRALDLSLDNLLARAHLE